MSTMFAAFHGGPRHGQVEQIERRSVIEVLIPTHARIDSVRLEEATTEMPLAFRRGRYVYVKLDPEPNGLSLFAWGGWR